MWEVLCLLFHSYFSFRHSHKLWFTNTVIFIFFLMMIISDRKWSCVSLHVFRYSFVLVFICIKISNCNFLSLTQGSRKILTFELKKEKILNSFPMIMDRNKIFFLLFYTGKIEKQGECTNSLSRTRTAIKMSLRKNAFNFFTPIY